MNRLRRLWATLSAERRARGFKAMLAAVWSHLQWRLGGAPPPEAPDAGSWVRLHRGIRPEPPDAATISILAPTVGWAPDDVAALVRSVREQTTRAWELLVGAAAGFGDGGLWEDGRVRLVEVGEPADPGAVFNELAGLASGSHLVFVTAPGVLEPTAVEWLAAAGRSDVTYADHDHLDRMGRHADPVFKPSWSPRLLLAEDYTAPLVAVRREAFDSVGGLRPRFGGTVVHDLLLRLSETAIEVAHLPNLLFHSTVVTKPRDATGETEAIEDALRRRSVSAHSEAGVGRQSAVFDPISDLPTVAVVMPTRDQPDLVRKSVEGVLGRTEGVDLHLVVVDNGSQDERALAYLGDLRRRDRVTVIRVDEPFNFSRLVNRGAEARQAADLLLLLNDDIEVRDPRWLLQLSGWLRDPGVAGAGPKLLLPDGRIQHAGMVVGMGGAAAHYMSHEPDAPRPGAFHDRAREMGCLTAACLLVRRADFAAVGGLDESFPLDFQDVDFCLRLTGATGGVLVYDPTFPLTHFEMATRGLEGAWADDTVARFRKRWLERIDGGDPYYSPHLSLYRHDLTLAGIPADVAGRRDRLRPRVAENRPA